MNVLEASLSDEAKRRYLNYALSVITARALPDVRDGLKPVQRRILLTMRRDLQLTPDAKHRKSAKIVGDVMGNYHPHGDSAIYDAMVRMAQPWVMRAPLVDGQGNFGSPDGDAAAAYRYTEAKLRPLALELLSELERRTVEWRPSYDGTKSEPVVLPARLPNLLINGSQGIAVGMATSIPPHNLNEIIDACVASIDAPEPLSIKQLLRHVKGPDFPTGGQLLATRDELSRMYETGSGTLKLRGDYKLEDRRGGGVDLVVTSVPYAIERGSLVEKIAEVITGKRLPSLLDVRDESTDEVRIVLELKRGTDPQLVMAYLYKHTPLQVTVAANLTCLVPAIGPDGQPTDALPPQPARLGLGAILKHFLDFRMLTVVRRLNFDLAQLKARIHVLDGFAIVFDALDETIRIIRKSEGRADAHAKLVKRFDLSDEQTEAILELRLYRLAQLEIQLIRKELAERRAEAKKLEVLLASEPKRWQLIKDELLDIKQKYGDRRRTKIVGSTDEPEYAAEDFIVDEDANVILTVQGWLKRARELKDLSTTRLREGDQVLEVAAGSTKAPVAFFSNYGVCYVTRVNDVPPTTGYGDPVQKLFKMADGERIVAMFSFDPRVLEVPPPPDESSEPPAPFAVAVTRQGMALRFSLSTHREPSTRAGRKFAKLAEGDEVLYVSPVNERDGVVLASSDGRALGVMVGEIAVLGGPGKGAIAIRLAENERVVGAQAINNRESVTLETEKGKLLEYSFKQVAGPRAWEGVMVSKQRLTRLVLPPPAPRSLEAN